MLAFPDHVKVQFLHNPGHFRGDGPQNNFSIDFFKYQHGILFSDKSPGLRDLVVSIGIPFLFTHIDINHQVRPSLLLCRH